QRNSSATAYSTAPHRHFPASIRLSGFSGFGTGSSVSGDRGWRWSRATCRSPLRSSAGGIVELRVPVGAAALGGGVEDGPDRHEVGGAARVLAGVGGRGAHL